MFTRPGMFIELDDGKILTGKTDQFFMVKTHGFPVSRISQENQSKTDQFDGKNPWFPVDFPLNLYQWTCYERMGWDGEAVARSDAAWRPEAKRWMSSPCCVNCCFFFKIGFFQLQEFLTSYIFSVETMSDLNFQ